MNILNKTNFCNVINELKRSEEFVDKLNSLFSEFQREDSVYNTGLEGVVVELLETMFDDNDTNWISYWIWEENFGETYSEGDGMIVPLRTAEELYDFPIKNMEEKQHESIKTNNRTD